MHCALNLFGTFRAGQDDTFDTRVQCTTDQLFVHLCNAQPRRNACGFAGANAMHDVFFRTQHVFEVENHKVVAREREHFAEQRGGQGVEETIDDFSLARAGEN
ncbi:hypothetical protein D9M71_626680 [compost metagenome]